MALPGAGHWNWRGGRKYDHAGYALVYVPGHPRASKHYVFEHILVVERAIGRFLPWPAVVHHVNKVKDENRHSNLVVLQDQGEHSALHGRLRTLRAGANPWTQKICGRCGCVRDLACFHSRDAGWCRDCVREESRRRHGAKPRAEHHPHSQLTNDDVRAIRHAVAGGERQVRVAERFGVSKFVVNDIVKRRKYKSVPDEAAA